MMHLNAYLFLIHFVFLMQVEIGECIPGINFYSRHCNPSTAVSIIRNLFVHQRNGDKYAERKESKYRKIINNMDLRQ